MRNRDGAALLRFGKFEEFVGAGDDIGGQVDVKVEFKACSERLATAATNTKKWGQVPAFPFGKLEGAYTDDDEGGVGEGGRPWCRSPPRRRPMPLQSLWRNP